MTLIQAPAVKPQVANLPPTSFDWLHHRKDVILGEVNPSHITCEHCNTPVSINESLCVDCIFSDALVIHAGLRHDFNAIFGNSKSA